jgi:hypothetical protein
VIDLQPRPHVVKNSAEKRIQLRNFERLKPFNPGENLPEFMRWRNCPAMQVRRSFFKVPIETENIDFFKTGPRSVPDLLRQSAPVSIIQIA